MLKIYRNEKKKWKFPQFLPQQTTKRWWKLEQPLAIWKFEHWIFLEKKGEQGASQVFIQTSSFQQAAQRELTSRWKKFIECKLCHRFWMSPETRYDEMEEFSVFLHFPQLFFSHVVEILLWIFWRFKIPGVKVSQGVNLIFWKNAEIS